MTLLGNYFFDNSKIIQVSPSPNSNTKETDKLVKKSLNIFAGSDHATGGEVIIKNTKWYLLELIWESSGK